MTSRQGTRKSPMAGSKKGKSTLRGGLGAVGGIKVGSLEEKNQNKNTQPLFRKVKKQL